MAQRDVSPTAWTAPGTAEVRFYITLRAHGADPKPIDYLVSSFSYSHDEIIDLSNGFNAVTVPNTTNCRGVLIIPPRGNSTTITLKGVTGDTGLAQHPNGIMHLTFPSSSPPSSVGLTAGAAITGVRFIWW